ncbi:flagellar biosynthesis protein FlhA [Halanaerobium congolense]|uniref:Flagellar biosynthesis protein FlhA n=3 Tax=Halanaerobium congolense TaxID=54121 RepID=A0A1I0B0H1_9FIRM|nr:MULTISPECIES: flagellar biosynthesis protein FlhA [Halanaerobium]KXS49948.1 MAG: flagellar biosynthesis protein FlhA [Halanaerobium sp. T82-1]PTX16529.1 flagellar biosynthesis protein FlhA [Halanaerobium congolense]PUU92498.1 MAG: Flagellar biosynthesis protein FlhA [Halanaerobium sp.]SDF59009.1 flagellar biosynthesis protein FlhA [Halanaerobium congolense]SET00215.1 flagellar biosynthesis protein FlhA [Halanaerobium congolense]
MDNSLVFSKITKNTDVVFALMVVSIIVMFIIPLPTMLLDMLLAANITFAMVIILVSIYTTEPLDLSVFPSLLLFATLFRLGLNISTTRLILGQGYAGEIIMSFGDFVVGGNYVVGLIIFLIIVVIQFVVITKGAERVAEVAARFTLDAMPGKQMSIDADLNAGVIDNVEAKREREKIRQEADFYGAMDGASKFVKGDAIAGIIITFINIVGGLVIGVLQQDMGIAQAAQTYILLTVGDGLVSQIPALLISTATGMVVTRAASDNNMGNEMTEQLLKQPKALFIASGVLLVIGFVPGLPTIPFLFLATFIAVLAYLIVRTAETDKLEEKKKPQTKEMSEEQKQEMRQEELKQLIKVDKLEIEVGYNLISLVLPEQGGDFLDRVSNIRKQIAVELGIILPPIRIVDNLQLPPDLYKIKLHGVELTKYQLYPDKFLAMDPGNTFEEIPGIETKEPAFGTEALWIEESQKENAELANYTVVDPGSVMATHLTEVIREHSHELLGREEVKKLIDNFKEDNEAVIDELMPDLLKLGEIQKILQNLLWEKIPINNLLIILETLADHAPRTKDQSVLTEYVRQGLSRQISNQFTAEDNTLYAITIDPQKEEQLINSVEQSDQGRYLSLEPAQAQDIINKIVSQVKGLLEEGRDPILLTSPMIRRPLKEMVHRTFSDLIVLSFNELESDIDLQVQGVVN